MKLAKLVPIAEVESVPRSIEFYQKLGFAAARTFARDNGTEPTWASLRHGDVELMIAKPEGERAPRPSVLFYLYGDDVKRARAELEAAGVPCGPIRYPFYASGGEFEVKDPDGYTVVIT